MIKNNIPREQNKDFPTIADSQLQHLQREVSACENNSPVNETELWSSDYLVSRLKQHLAQVELTTFCVKTDKLDDGRNFDSRKYFNQAFHYLKIGALKPPPAFLISLSDLSPRLVKELAELDKEDRDCVLKQATGRIFEDINIRLYHKAFPKYSRWNSDIDL